MSFKEQLTQTLTKSLSLRPIHKSPVPHLLKSNIPPTEKETILIKKAIKQADTLIESFPSVTSGIPTAIQEKSKPKKLWITLTNFRNAHQALLSPIRRIPMEILMDIFLYVHEIQISPIPRVSQVCHFWRETALSTPLLWTRIELSLDQTKFRKLKYLPISPESSHKPFVDLCLERSRNAPLTLELSVSNQADVDHPAFQKMLDCSNRWQNVDFTFPIEVISSLHRIRGRLSYLRRLALCIPGRQWLDTCDLFQHAPLLHKVRLVYGVLSLSLPWSQLSTFVENNGTNAVMDIQQQTILLGSASTLYLWSSNIVVPTGSELIQCMNLTTLHIYLRHNENSLFAKIYAPKIEEINVRVVNWDITPSLTVMVENSPSPSLLRRLTFHYNFDLPGTLITLLERTPKLEELDIHLPYEIDLRRFIWDPHTAITPLLPALSKLHFFVSWASTVSGHEDTLAEIASTRCEPNIVINRSKIKTDAPVATLESFKLQFANHDKRLQGLRLVESAISDTEVPVKYIRWGLFLATALASESSIKENLEEINSIFSSLMSESINIRYLYHNEIHIILNTFVNWSQISTRYDQKHKLRLRAQEILSKWNPLMLEDVQNRKWGLSYDNCLLYIPRNDGIRENDPLSIFYGPDIQD